MWQVGRRLAALAQIWRCAIIAPGTRSAAHADVDFAAPFRDLLQPGTLDAFLGAMLVEAGVPLTWPIWPRTYLAVLDVNGDQSVTQGEFLSAINDFERSMSDVEALALFAQFDANLDGLITAKELVVVVRAHHPQAAEGVPITPVGYRSRLAGASGSVGITLEISGIRKDNLSSTDLRDLKRLIVLSFAAAAGVTNEDVLDASLRRGEVSVFDHLHELLDDLRSAEEHLQPRRLASQASDKIVIAGLIEAPAGSSVADVVDFLQSRRDALAKDVSRVAGLGHGVTAESMHAKAIPGATVAFLFADTSLDRWIDSSELESAARDWARPLSTHEARYIFDGLDADVNGGLSLKEFEAADVEKFAEPPFRGRRIPFADFDARLRRAFAHGQDAFDAMLSLSAGRDDYARLAERLRPALSEAQATYTFHRFDTDGDSILGNAEFLKVLRFGGFGVTPAQLDAMFSRGSLITWIDIADVERASLCLRSSAALHVAAFLVAAYVLRLVAVAIHVPGAVGVALAAALLTWQGFDPVGPLRHTGELQEFVLTFVLFMAGFGLRLPSDIASLPTAVAAVLPGSLEVLAIAGYAVFNFGLPADEALLVGASLFATGGGVVVAKMHSIGRYFPESPMPRVLASWAPAETCFGAYLWALLAAAATSGQAGAASFLSNCTWALLAAIPGGLLGFLSGVFLSMPRLWPLSKTTAEGALFAVSIPLAAQGAAAMFAPSVRLQRDIFVVAYGVGLSSGLSPQALEAVDAPLGDAWIFAQYMLFGLFGRGLNASMFHDWKSLVPMMFVGLAMRFVGVVLVLLLRQMQPECRCERCRLAQGNSVIEDAFFWFFATLPRTSLQALVAGPGLLHITAVPGAVSLQALRLVVSSARLYFMCLSVLGSLALDCIGPTLMANDPKRPRCEDALAHEAALAAAGRSARQQALLGGGSRSNQESGSFRLCLVSEESRVVEFASRRALPLPAAVGLMAKVRNEDPVALAAWGDRLARRQDRGMPNAHAIHPSAKSAGGAAGGVVVARRLAESAGVVDAEPAALLEAFPKERFFTRPWRSSIQTRDSMLDTGGEQWQLMEEASNRRLKL